MCGGGIQCLKEEAEGARAVGRSRFECHSSRRLQRARTGTEKRRGPHGPEPTAGVVVIHGGGTSRRESTESEFTDGMQRPCSNGSIRIIEPRTSIEARVGSVHRAGGQAGGAPDRVLTLQEVSHDASKMAWLDPAKRGHEPTGHGGSVFGEVPESFERAEVTALDRADREGEHQALRGIVELGIEEMLSAIAGCGQAVEMGNEAIVKPPETQQADVRQLEVHP